MVVTPVNSHQPVQMHRMAFKGLLTLTYSALSSRPRACDNRYQMSLLNAVPHRELDVRRCSITANVYVAIGARYSALVVLCIVDFEQAG
jgi:hypothetical protein